jgi:hypothetical protein
MGMAKLALPISRESNSYPLIEEVHVIPAGNGLVASGGTRPARSVAVFGLSPLMISLIKPGDTKVSKVTSRICRGLFPSWIEMSGGLNPAVR